jgi:hypothetical protein
MTKIIDNIPEYKVLNAFLETDKIPGKVVLTPISYIYEEFKRRLYVEDKERLNGWWDNFTGKTKNKKEVMIVKTHQGNTIVDPILTFNDRCDYLLFLGFCGGLHPNMRIGDITIATQSYFENEDVFYKPKSNLSEVMSMFPYSISGTNLTVESVIREMLSIKSKLGYFKEDTVSADQETAYLYRESKTPSASVMLVMDLPLSRSFFELNRLDKKHIKDGINKLSDGILELIDLL